MRLVAASAGRSCEPPGEWNQPSSRFELVAHDLSLRGYLEAQAVTFKADGG
ncbi:MAG: hypothetical protein AW08_03684 [Candidatus Accumulibacter adjunctus]|uniref:Uncharacterized protein n=1 Tax=Candidatus Accumulibacter adjunctus TaxID=1454001 RepID=A0A011NIP2_9PROT|nr:MAG: hypothetical protein AW08_03684 [Candidatus Accumulibacter adjunctus]